MTAAMAFFSVALTLNLTGIQSTDLRASDLRPSSITRSFAQANAHVVRYYDNLRVVYELESRVHDLQHTTDSEPIVRPPPPRLLRSRPTPPRSPPEVNSLHNLISRIAESSPVSIQPQAPAGARAQVAICATSSLKIDNQISLLTPYLPQPLEASIPASNHAVTAGPCAGRKTRMNCANHPDRERIAFCQNCGKPLCQECARTVGSAVFCEPCLAARLAEARGPLGWPYEL